MRNLVVQVAERAAEEPAIEMCEHKGIGHPDTIADGVCEAVAQALARAYEEDFGAPMHFNVDKGLLVGGKSEPRFGGGRIFELPKLFITGRASALKHRDLTNLIVGAAAKWLDASLRPGAALFEISPEVRQGSPNLTPVVGKVARANDTSFGMGYAPLSALENKVLALSRAARDLREHVPAAGDDFKIMGLRKGSQFVFTVAIALIDNHVRKVAEYAAAKTAILERLTAAVEEGDRVLVNQLDRPDATHESELYLTVSGLSAEMGDDGQVGRGNRVNGLITPGRPMSLEAAAGKNPYAHVGKIYNVLAHRIARRVCAELPEVRQASVRLLSTIGAPIDQPQIAFVELGTGTPALRERAAAIVDGELDRLDELVAALVAGKVAVY